MNVVVDVDVQAAKAAAVGLRQVVSAVAVEQLKEVVVELLRG